MEPLPTAAARLSLEWPRQLRRDPTAIETSRLCNNLDTIDTAMEIVGVKGNALSQRLRSSQGLRIAPGDLWQAPRTGNQIQILRGAFPLAE